MKTKFLSQSPNYQYLLTALLITVWIVGHIWTYAWFIDSLFESSLLNILCLLVAIAVLPFKLWRAKTFTFKHVSVFPQFRFTPLMIMISGEVMAIVLKWIMHIPQLTMMGFILASYGLLGLFIEQKIWHKNLTLAVITAGITPFSVAFSSGLGFPVRVISAHLVADIFSYLHLSAISSHDIILMENGIAQVDLPCSGLKSLWLGSVFLLGATWLEKRQLGLRWFAVAIANLFFLLVANLVRIFILVLLIEVLQKPEIAHSLHLPLGLLGFIYACIFTWILLQRVPIQDQKVISSVKENRSFIYQIFNRSQNSAIKTVDVVVNNQKAAGMGKMSKMGKMGKMGKREIIYLLTIVVALTIVGQFAPPSSNLSTLSSINLPAEIITEPIELSEAETDFFDHPANPLVEKVKFKADGLSGSMLLVASDTWHLHHSPELCYVGNGFQVDRMNSTILNGNINARWLSINNGQRSAIYWFQSSQQTTDDFLTRIWENITHSDQAWFLVSVLFDESLDVSSNEIQSFSNTLYHTIDRALTS